MAQQSLPFRIVADFSGAEAGLLRGWAGGCGFFVGGDRKAFVGVVEVLFGCHWGRKRCERPASECAFEASWGILRGSADGGIRMGRVLPRTGVHDEAREMSAQG